MNPLPQRLYHYCSFEKALQIISSNVFWAHDLRTMNDSGEMIYSRGVLSDVISREIAEAPVGYYRPLDDGASAAAYYFRKFDRQLQHTAYFAVCLSVKPSQPSMWATYADNGHGVSIGFDTEVLRKSYPSSYALPVIYDPDEQNAVTTRAFYEVYEAFAGLYDSIPDDEDDEPFLQDYAFLYASRTFKQLAECIFSLKHPSFAHEAECRFVYEVSRGAYKTAGVMAEGSRERLELSLVSAIAEVVCGPRYAIRHDLGELRRALDQAGHVNAEITQAA